MCHALFPFSGAIERSIVPLPFSVLWARAVQRPGKGRAYFRWHAARPIYSGAWNLPACASRGLWPIAVKGDSDMSRSSRLAGQLIRLSFRACCPPSHRRDVPRGLCQGRAKVADEATMTKRALVRLLRSREESKLGG